MSEVEELDGFRESYDRFRKEIAKVIVGQDEVVKNVLISIFSQGHCLLVGVPGLAKTLLVQTIAQSLGLKFNRIQFSSEYKKRKAQFIIKNEFTKKSVNIGIKRILSKIL